jgi:hypothetical protein
MNPLHSPAALFRLTICLSCSLFALQTAYSQNASAPAQPQPNSTSNVTRRGDFGAFMEFIDTEGQINANDQRNLAEGRQPQNPGSDWPEEIRHVCTLREDEAESVYAVALDTYDRVKKHDKLMDDFKDAHFNTDPPAQLSAELAPWFKERQSIYREGIDRMKQHMGGDESFERLRECIDRTYGANDVIHMHARPPRTPTTSPS